MKGTVFTMSDYTKDIFVRSDLGQIREFLLHGVETYEIENNPYNIRLKQGSDPIYERLRRIYPDEKHMDEANSDLAQALGTYEAVYTEIGMKAGARIIFQLLLSD